MVNFTWWWALLLLPLPWLLRRYWAPAESPELALSIPLLSACDMSVQRQARASNRIIFSLIWMVWVCLLVSAARPYWLGEPVSRSVSGRDLMLAVDISGSMSEADMTINANTASRLDVLKLVVTKFIDRRQGDRLGLILFGTNAYTLLPLTFDLDTFKVLLQDVSTGLAGRHTAIGDAIGLALKSMRAQQAEHKVLVLATDGSNTAGFEDPVKVAVAAGRQNLTIYTIGIGSDAETLGRTYGINNIPPGTALNERVLQQIAAATGGEYFRATDSASLRRIYQALDRLEPVKHEYLSFRPHLELFAYPLFAALMGLLCLMAFSARDSGRHANDA